MIRIFIRLFLPVLIFQILINAQSNHPKREFRGAWIATVLNLDWPSSPSLSTDQQKQQLIDMLDGLKAAGINAVIFQVRSECDAMYSSNIEPWSYWLTGQQGKAPNPFYDPLQFAVEEAHKRGMELHAWFNPYQADRNTTDYPVASNHVTVLHPDWLLRFGTKIILDPGLQMVRDYVTSVIIDVVKRYDIDGVHFDDFFYPYEGITNEDDATFAHNNRGFTNRGNWRRDNVNIFIKEVHDSIQAVKPYIKFGISPFGIWKNGVPPGTTGLDAYSEIYCDPIAWLHQGIVDYLAPQLYWKFGGGQDYGKLLPWWGDSASAYNRHLYPGLAPYHLGDQQNWASIELPNQVRANRNNPHVQGSIFFRTMAGILDNEKGFADSLKNNLFKYPALLPVMNWKDTIKPNPPSNLIFGRSGFSGISKLKWDLPTAAIDGDTASRYVVYHFNNSTPKSGDYENAENILTIEGKRESIPSPSSGTAGPYFFSITALDRNYNESFPGNIVEITKPVSPLLSMPYIHQMNVRDTVRIKWFYADQASAYHLQIGIDSTFNSNILFNLSSLTDTTLLIAGISGQVKYYWRVQASNIAGESIFSTIYDFTTGFPVTPLLSEPSHASLNVSLNPILKWAGSLTADTYRLQLSKSLTFNEQTIIVDTSGITDTTFYLENLKPLTNYFWRVAGINEYGSSLWSTSFGFKTMEVLGVDDNNEIPADYSLSQNFPNPFNPITNIDFSLPHAGFVTLKVYNLLGQKVKTLINGYRDKGYYEITLDASDLASGIYIYRLVAENHSFSRKMVVLK